MDPTNIYRGKVTYVVSGNQYDVVLDLGFFLTIRVPVVMEDIEIPLKRSRSHEDRILAQAAKDAAMEVLLNRGILVSTEKDSHHPRTWRSRIFLDATVPEEHSGVMADVFGEPKVDFSSYMNALREYNFNPKAIELRHVESRGSRKAPSRGR